LATWRAKESQATPVAWARECQNAFDRHNKALGDAPVLALPDPEAKYCLHLDASQHALGAVLSQVQDKAEKVLGNISRRLHNAELQYAAYDRELLGIQNAILYWKFNLHGAEEPFLLHTDDAAWL